MKSKIIIAVLVVAVGAGAFYGGMKYQQTKPSGNRQFQAGAAGNRFQGQNRPGSNQNGGGAPVIGEILSQDDKSITVKLPDGSSKIVILPETVTISKTATGSKVDLTTGAQVGVFGTTNADGTVTAQNVQLNPMFRMGRNPSQQPSPASSPQ